MGQPSSGVPGHAEVADWDGHLADDVAVVTHVDLQREAVPGEVQVDGGVVVAEVSYPVCVLRLLHPDHPLTISRV